MPHSLSVEPSQRIFGSSTGQEGRAIVQHPVAAGRLPHTVGFSNQRLKRTTNVSSCLFRLRLGGERLRTKFSLGDSCSALYTYPSLVGYHPLMPCHLMKQIIGNKFDQSRKRSVPSITTFILQTRPWTTPKVCAAVIRASSWVNRSNLWRTDSISLSPNNFFANFSTKQ
jgi:hypothetical protein